MLPNSDKGISNPISQPSALSTAFSRGAAAEFAMGGSEGAVVWSELGLRSWGGLGFRVQGSGFRVQGLGFRV